MRVTVRLAGRRGSWVFRVNPSAALHHLKRAFCRALNLDHLTTDVAFTLPNSGYAPQLTQRFRQLQLGDELEFIAEIRTHQPPAVKELLSPPGLTALARCTSHRCPLYNTELGVSLGEGVFSLAVLWKNLKCPRCPDRCSAQSPPMSVFSFELRKCFFRTNGEFTEVRTPCRPPLSQTGKLEVRYKV